MHAAPSGAAPDGRPSVAIRVLRIDPGTVHQVLMLSEKCSGLFTHWVRGRSSFCSDGPCENCGRFPERFWKGYVSAVGWDKAAKRWLPVVLEVTESLELDFRYRYQRGQVWRLVRGPLDRRKQPPVRGALIELRADGQIPPAHDVLPCLQLLYHNPAVRLGWKSPLPDRATAEVPDCAPPPGETPLERPSGPQKGMWELAAEMGSPELQAAAAARLKTRREVNGNGVPH